MPLYEYRCESCSHRFEALVQGSSRPTCAKCGGRRLEKLLSTFAVAGGSSATFEPGTDAGCGTCGDPRGPGSCSRGGD